MNNFRVSTSPGTHRDLVELLICVPVDSEDRVEEFLSFLNSIVASITPVGSCKRVLVLDLTKLPSVPWVNPFLVSKLVSGLAPLVEEIKARFDTCLYMVPNLAYKLASTLILKLFPCTRDEVVRCFSWNEEAEFRNAQYRARVSRCARDLVEQGGI